MTHHARRRSRPRTVGLPSRGERHVAAASAFLLREHDTLGSGLIARLVGEPACEPAHDPIADGHHVGAGGHRVERERQPVLVGDKHPVGHQQVEVHASG